MILQKNGPKNEAKLAHSPPESVTFQKWKFHQANKYTQPNCSTHMFFPFYPFLVFCYNAKRQGITKKLLRSFFRPIIVHFFLIHFLILIGSYRQCFQCKDVNYSTFISCYRYQQNFATCRQRGYSNSVGRRPPVLYLRVLPIFSKLLKLQILYLFFTCYSGGHFLSNKAKTWYFCILQYKNCVLGNFVDFMYTCGSHRCSWAIFRGVGPSIPSR